MKIPYEQMQDVLYILFLNYKFTDEKARLLVNVFTENTLSGVNSHGINRVPLFISYLEKGLVNVEGETEKVETFGSIKRWDRNFGLVTMSILK